MLTNQKIKSRWTVCGICIFLAAIVFVVFGQTAHFEFINFDDDVRVYENPHVTGGLTLKGIAWAFTQSSSSDTYWDPLSAISHMLDWQLHGNNAGGHHLTNVLLHAATAILLFLALWRMTGALWRSAFVAAIFAIHPLRVESVAWVTERRDVLSGLFFMLTLWAYAGYARDRKPVASYLLALCFFALGLMSKPMLVTLPFVLLLLDYWPLNRSAKQRLIDTDNKPNVPVLIVEKIPFFAFSAIFSVITIISQRGLMTPVENVSIPLRLGNALISCAIYIKQMFWPLGLALLYPYPGHAPSFWELAAAFILLAAISAAVLVWRRTRPWLVTGWLWYLGMLVPVSGILQSGEQAHADRFTYLPQIGMYLLVTWAVADLVPAWRYRRAFIGCTMVVTIAALTVCAFIQTSYWQSSTTIWTHTLAVTSRNRIAHDNLGNALQQQGQMDEAIAHYRKALEINPDYAGAHNNLADALQHKGHLDEAISHFRRALEINPGYATADYNLGNALLRKGRVVEAISFYRKAIELNPDYVKAHANLGNALEQQGRMREALAHYQKAVDLKPDLAAALNNLALVLATAPDATLRNGQKAVDLAQQANHLAGRRNPSYLGTLAAAYAESGRFPEAVETVQNAILLAASQGNNALASLLKTHLKLYQAGRPLRAGL